MELELAKAKIVFSIIIYLHLKMFHMLIIKKVIAEHLLAQTSEKLFLFQVHMRKPFYYQQI
jgi:hypothetical protein